MRYVIHGIFFSYWISLEVLHALKGGILFIGALSNGVQSSIQLLFRSYSSRGLLPLFFSLFLTTRHMPRVSFPTDLSRAEVVTSTK